MPMNADVSMIIEVNLGCRKTIITNYATHKALRICNW